MDPVRNALGTSEEAARFYGILVDLVPRKDDTLKYPL